MTFPATFNISTLDGANGFNITGPAGSYLGWSVASAGDVNGDGKPDLIVGAIGYPIPTNTAYVIFGSSSFLPTLSTSSLNGTNGFTLTGPAGSYFGSSVAGAGDLNGDGKSDFVVGTDYANSNAGTAYVIFGTSSFPSTLAISSLTLNGINGFTLTGPASSFFGDRVASAGDVNVDGKSDLVVGAYGAAYVIFGASTFQSTIDVSSLNGTNGFKITGPSAFGNSVASASDLNGDGKPDLVIGSSQTAYVIFGWSSFPATIDVSSLNGTNGFTLTGPAGPYFGYVGTGAGDVNHDGIADLVVGASHESTAYVIFGSSSFPSTVPTSSLNGINGFNILGPANSSFGYSVAGGGDVNGDGKSDLVVGAFNNATAYVIFGSSSFSSTLITSSLNGTNGFTLIGPTNSSFGNAVSSAGDLNTDGKADAVFGADTANTAYVIFGGPPAAAITLPPPPLTSAPLAPYTTPLHADSDSWMIATVTMGTVMGVSLLAAATGMIAYAKVRGLYCFKAEVHHDAAGAVPMIGMSEEQVYQHVN